MADDKISGGTLPKCLPAALLRYMDEYNVVREAGKAAVAPAKLVLVRRDRLFGADDWHGGVRLERQWEDSSGIVVAPPHRVFEPSYFVPPPGMDRMVPDEDWNLFRSPSHAPSGIVHVLRRITAAVQRTSDRRIIRRNPAAPMDFGHLSQKANETQWIFHRLIEAEDNDLLELIGYDIDGDLDEDGWREALALAEGAAA